LILTGGLVGLLAGLWKIGAWQYKRLFLIAAVLGICQSGWSAIVSVQWSDMIMVLRSELRTHTGAIPYSSSLMSSWGLDGQPIRTLTSEWAMPPLSILYSDHRTVKSMVVQDPGTFRPFNPYLASTLPKLQRFGFDFKPYLAALPATRDYELGNWISFNEQGETEIQKDRGWWNTEAWGTWSSDEATLRVNLPQPVTTDLLLQAKVAAFVNKKNSDVDVQVLVNNVPAGQWSFHYKPDVTDPYEQRELVIPKDALNRAHPPIILFLVSGAHSPYELGMGGDPRKLGFAMVQMRLVACSGDICGKAASAKAAAAR
jgi:hypothetical protein